MMKDNESNLIIGAVALVFVVLGTFFVEIHLLSLLIGVALTVGLFCLYAYITRDK